MDKIDFKILHALHYNARASLSFIAKEVNISKQLLNHRLQQLENKGVIKGYVAVIDPHKLNLLTYRLYLRLNMVDTSTEHAVLDYFTKHESTLWVVSLIGNWDLEIVFVARNYIQYSNILKKMRDDIGKFIANQSITLSIVNNHFSRDYLINTKRDIIQPKYYGFEPENNELDDLDKKIVLQLSKNCRQTNTELGLLFGVTYHTIKNRILRLEKKGILVTYRLLLDLSKLKRIHLKANIKFKKLNKETEMDLYAFCQKNNKITYLVEVLGEYQYEIEAEVASLNDFNIIIKELRNKFQDKIEDYYVLEVLNEHKLNYLPLA